MHNRRARRAVLAAVLVVVVAGASFGVYTVIKGSPAKGANPGGNSHSSPAAPLLTVSGNKLMSSTGKPVRLIGVNLSGSRNCLFKYTQPFPAPANSSTVSALESWHVNAVRMTLNESCWFGIDGEPHAMSVAQYRGNIESLVPLLTAAHIEVIITLYANTITTTTVKSAGGTPEQKRTPNTDPMADAAYGPKFWTSVATTFRGDAGVMFDLYNEPQNITWPCWENGCTVHGTKYVGMQQLVDAVRATGARQPLLLGGVDFATNLSGWLAHEPNDPDHDLVASVHVYSQTPCHTPKCWTTTIGTLAKKIPVITGEFGSKTCDSAEVQQYMKWSDKRNISYLAWAWTTGSCSTTSGPLLANYAGAPSSFGSIYKSHLTALFQAGHGDIGTVTTRH